MWCAMVRVETSERSWPQAGQLRFLGWLLSQPADEQQLVMCRGKRNPAPEREAGYDPDSYYKHRSEAARGFHAFGLHPLVRSIPTFRKDGSRNHPDDQPYQPRKQDYIVNVTQHRNEVWYQVYGTQGVCNDEDCQNFGIPRRLRVPSGEPKRYTIALDSLCPFFQTISPHAKERIIIARSSKAPTPSEPERKNRRLHREGRRPSTHSGQLCRFT